MLFHSSCRTHSKVASCSKWRSIYLSIYLYLSVCLSFCLFVFVCYIIYIYECSYTIFLTAEKSYTEESQAISFIYSGMSFVMEQEQRKHKNGPACRLWPTITIFLFAASSSSSFPGQKKRNRQRSNFLRRLFSWYMWECAECTQHIRSCPWLTIRGRAACEAVAPWRPSRSIWTAPSATAHATETQRRKLLQILPS